MNPWAEHATRNNWKERLAAIEQHARVSIAAACLERSVTLYLAWARQHDAEGEEIARGALDMLWEFTAGGDPPR